MDSGAVRNCFLHQVPRAGASHYVETRQTDWPRIVTEKERMGTEPTGLELLVLF